ncbi:helix-turn-helix domain-containing protein [Flavicella sediminum]|uniref:helix-turn-helix domain-containing protein n=1 Tax=Flavicella sediminum TaxID=2585141 RepID=UPI00111E01AB|nr:AraC family transcriptional regulator [Flavicella sediminum]
MEICLQSVHLEQGELVKIFEKDFYSVAIKENEWNLKTDRLEGTLQDIELNKVYVFIQNLKNKGNLEFVVSNDTPLFKLHFEIEGTVFCNLNDTQKNTFRVEKGTYNLFYLPESKRTYTYKETHRNSLEIYFSEPFLQNIMGYCFTGTSQDLKNSKLKKCPCVFFKDGILLNEQINAILKEIVNCHFTEVMKKAFLEAKITELFLVCLTNFGSKKEESGLSLAEKNCLKSVEKHIKQNLQKELTISELSLLAGMNTSKLKKSFKQLYGSTVFKYITALRIEKAKELIQKENYTISQASYEVGYKNPQHFTVAFKKKLGYLPSQLKKEI